ncbi:MAG: Gfo/Idh/MocA family oxidoreductase [Planctomycetia bacterium]|nr:Gfo/Idh/MocA family oxidoreductase [Planctomycetia bacterium]
MSNKRLSDSSTSRRAFLKTSAVAAAGAGLAASAGFVPQALAVGSPNSHVGGSDELKIGIVGCGGRGSGAVIDALSADPHCKLTAAGDVFGDVVNGQIAALKNHPQYGARIAVDKEHTFVGFDAYKQVIDSGVDVVLLTTTPHFRPIHLKYAIEKGKHVFAEKPVAVDPAGIRSVLESCAEAKKKNLAVLSGLCYRYHKPKVETQARIHDGAVGDIVAMHTSYNTGTLWHRGHAPKWSDMEYQIRNWLYFTWLSGDFICEQHVHSLDKMAWAMKDQTPLKVSSIGGRQQRTDPKYGQVYDHFCSVFTYPSGVKLFSTCRQQSGCATDVNDYVMGTKGTADLMQARISGEKPWHYNGPQGNMYRDEHIALFGSIRDGKPLNNGQYMAQSTMLAIMARMSAYSGQDVTWDAAMKSTLDLSPKAYEWGKMSTPPVAVPGVG